MTPPKVVYPQVKVTNFDEPCAVSSSCFSFSIKKAHQRKWLKDKKLYEAKTNLGDRVMTPVTIVGDSDKVVYLMDIITGSLYDFDTKRCLTSTYIKMKKFVRRNDLAKTLLEKHQEQP